MKFFRILVITAITLSAAFLVKKFVVEPTYTASGSMEPTLYKGHRLFLDKVTYKFRIPRRGEIISFVSPAGEEHESIKRVIAVEGDTVEIKTKKVYLNGEPLVETYVKYTRPNEILIGDNLGPVTVPPGHLFVLGDNRDNSSDSATWQNPAVVTVSGTFGRSAAVPQTGGRIYFLPVEKVTGKIRGIY
ncbi:MAG: signal peptidase I [Elusimicrobia bacterium]|nr:signal peptidase I [Elusimicrobiota bacterium]